MKNSPIRFQVLSAIAAALLLSGCYSTSLTSTWRSCEAPPEQFEKIAVVAMISSNTARTVVEDAMVRELRAYGLSAVSTVSNISHGSIPAQGYDAADTASMSRRFRDSIDALGADGVIFVNVLDAKKQEHYVPGGTVHYVQPVYGGFGLPWVYPLRYYPWAHYPYYRYYTYQHVTVHSPGYYYETTDYYVETSLFDAETGRLLWVGQTVTSDPESVNREAPEFARVIVEGLMRDRAVVPLK